MSKKNEDNNHQSIQSNNTLNTLNQASKRLAGASNNVAIKSLEKALEKALEIAPRPSSTITERASTPSNSEITTISPPDIKNLRRKNRKKSNNGQQLNEASIANNGRYNFKTNKHGKPITNAPGNLDKIHGPVAKFGGPYSAFTKVGGRKSVRNKKNKKKNKKSKNKSIKRQK
jgi:hypothetical protein